MMYNIFLTLDPGQSMARMTVHGSHRLAAIQAQGNETAIFLFIAKQLVMLPINSSMHNLMAFDFNAFMF